MIVLLGAVDWTNSNGFLGLLLIPLVIYFAWKSTSDAPYLQRAISILCRCAIIVLLTFICSGLFSTEETSPHFVVFVADQSDSVGQSNAQVKAFTEKVIAHQSNATTAFISFGKIPTNKANDQFPELQFPVRSASNPAEAISQAASLIPDDYLLHVILLTDGIETQGNLLETAKHLNVPVSTFPIDAFPQGEVGIAKVIAPPQSHPGAPVSIEVVVDSSKENRGELSVGFAPGNLQKQTVELTPGRNRFAFSIEKMPLQSLGITARLDNFQDTYDQNNSLQAYVLPKALPEVLIVDRQPKSIQPLATALNQSQFMVNTVATEQLPNTSEELKKYDAVILSDVPGKNISSAQREALRNYVHQQGGGLIVMGGDDVYAEAQFRKTIYEDLLPVLPARKIIKEQQSSLAMVLVMDTSASMKEERRMILAKQAAAKMISILKPEHKIGLLGFSTYTNWVSEIQPATDKSKLLKQIDSIEATGKTNMYLAMEKAYYALEQADADKKHMIVLTDGVSTPGNFAELSKDLASAGISVTTVSVSQGADQSVLKDIVSIAQGKHFHCDDAADLEEILLEQTQEAIKPQRDAKFTPFLLRRLPGLDLSSAPPLEGHVSTSPKPNTEVLLVATEGDPLLTWQRYGLGVTMAFTSDAKNQWGKQWVNWKGYGNFWNQMTRLAMRRKEPQDVVVTATRKFDRLNIKVDVVDSAGRLLNDAQVMVRMGSTLDNSTELMAAQTAPGHYEFNSKTEVDTPILFEVIVKQGSDVIHQEQQMVTGIYLPEYQVHLSAKDSKSISANHELLKEAARVSGGLYQPEVAELFSHPPGKLIQVYDWKSWLLFAAILLFVLDVLLKRLNVKTLLGKS